MANYYLPVEIKNDKKKGRWHICHLNEVSNPNAKEKDNTFSFIIDNRMKTLLEIPYKAKFISERGYAKNIKMSELAHHRICKKDNTFYVDFIKGEIFPFKDNKTKDRSIDGIFISKGNKSNSPYVVEIDNGIFSHTSFNIVIRLLLTKKEIVREENDKKNKRPEVKITEEYAYGFQIHLCDKQSSSFIEAAIDFGSEASQVSLREGDKNGINPIQLTDLFKNHYYTDYTNENRFWQSDSNTNFFKSIVFINKDIRSQGGNITDEPFAKKEASLTQMLRPKNAPENENLVILPNLKLIECISEDSLNRKPINILFNEKNNGFFSGNDGNVSLYAKDTIEKLLRTILNQLLFAISEKSLAHKIEKRYICLTLLMPNVYLQHKVYTLIKNLYEDFYEIAKQKKYECFKGIEIKMISESDASFLGALNNAEWKVQNKAGHFLIIDAGKGTTDFSILKQSQESHINFDSIYRTGIPASGHVLTYAFFEVLADLLKDKRNINLKDIVLKSDDRPAVLEFMEHLEKLKINYNPNKTEEQVDQIELRNDDIASINNYLDNHFAENPIPGTKKKVNKKIDDLFAKINDEIDEAGITEFEQVIFTGRGFMFAPFRKKVIEELNRRYTIKNEIIFKDSDLAKTICIYGAFKNNININLNSELIGIPKFKFYPPKKADNKKESTFLTNLFQPEKDIIDDTFFINGIKSTDTRRSYDIRIGGRDISGRLEQKGDKYLFFTGDGFIVQYKDSIEDKVKDKDDRPGVSDLALQSLFPYYQMNTIESQKKSLGNNTRQNDDESGSTETIRQVQQEDLSNKSLIKDNQHHNKQL